MADPQFEHFREVFEKLPQHIKAPDQCYMLTHDISPVSGSEESLEDSNFLFNSQNDLSSMENSSRDDYFCKKVKENLKEKSFPNETINGRKRRKLPQIPSVANNRAPTTSSSVVFTTRRMTLADEIREAEASNMNGDLPVGVYFDYSNTQQTDIANVFFHDNSQFQDENYSIDDGKDQCIDIDSGNSTTHSPDGARCFSPIINVSSSTSPNISNGTLELLEASHRGLHKFIPRHQDEISVEIGDPVYVEKEADDLWCEGVNLRTGKKGIFPGAYVTDVDYTEFDPEGVQIKKERYLLRFLGSLEVKQHKGNEVLCQSVKKIAKRNKQNGHHIIKSSSSSSIDADHVDASNISHPCILEVSDQGLRMIDKSKSTETYQSEDYFFSLKNITFCGYHPKDHRYFGFITKHPTQNRFACHVFNGEQSTRSVAESVGRAFHRFYHKFIENAYPVEDIYLE